MKKSIRVSDLSDVEIVDGQGATAFIRWDDARKGEVRIDLTASEADEWAKNGQRVKRRGRKPAKEK